MKKQKSTQNPKDWYFADAVVLVFVDVGQKNIMEERAIIKQRGKCLFIPLHGKMLDDCKTCDERGDQQQL